MAEAQWQQRQFGGYWNRDQDQESENYFPEPLSPWQRAKLPDISGQPIGIHAGGGGGGVGGFRRGRLVSFHRNGDPHFKGLSASISQKAFASMDSLLAWLSEKIPTTAGVRHVLRLPDGRPVRDVSELQPGGHYAVSSVRRLVRGGPDYGGAAAAAPGEGGPPRQWLADGPSSVAGRMRHSDIRLLARRRGGGGGEEAGGVQRLRRSPLAGGVAAAPGRPRLITVVSNSHRSSREKVLLNPGTRLNFEDLLGDFTSLLAMSGPPVRALYTAIPPYRRVESFSQLFREFGDHDTFIACGRELTPVELVGVAGKRGDAPPATGGGASSSGGDSSGSAATAAAAAAAAADKPSRKFSRRAEDDRHQYG